MRFFNVVFFVLFATASVLLADDNEIASPHAAVEFATLTLDGGKPRMTVLRAEEVADVLKKVCCRSIYCEF